eukprot:110497-Rhodomonas_salina.2
MTTLSLQTSEASMLSQRLWVHADGSFGLKVEGAGAYRSKFMPSHKRMMTATELCAPTGGGQASVPSRASRRSIRHLISALWQQRLGGSTDPGVHLIQ